MSLFPEFESLSEEELRSLIRAQPPERAAITAISLDGLRIPPMAASSCGDLRSNQAAKDVGIIDGLSQSNDRNGIDPLLAESIFSIDEIVLVAGFDAARLANVILPPIA
jgi:hypothetical protein